MEDHLVLGKLGEDLAAEYLKKRGYRIVSRNYRKKWGEIDIIAVKSGLLSFFEIKTMRQFGNWANCLTPEDQLTQAKLERFARIAETFAVKHPKLFHGDRGWRLDLLAITMLDYGNAGDPLVLLGENVSRLPTGQAGETFFEKTLNCVLPGRVKIKRTGEGDLLTYKGKHFFVKHYQNIA